MTTLKKDASSISVMVDTNANLFETTIVYIPLLEICYFPADFPAENNSQVFLRIFLRITYS
jgi:hypothetical protein